jgi:hypothetical protein
MGLILAMENYAKSLICEIRKLEATNYIVQEYNRLKKIPEDNKTQSIKEKIENYEKLPQVIEYRFMQQEYQKTFREICRMGTCRHIYHNPAHPNLECMCSHYLVLVEESVSECSSRKACIICGHDYDGCLSEIDYPIYVKSSSFDNAKKLLMESCRLLTLAQLPLGEIHAKLMEIVNAL